MAMGVEKLSRTGKTVKTGTPIYGRVSRELPRYGFGPETPFFVDKTVDG
jgi:hypothetical protein